MDFLTFCRKLRNEGITRSKDVYRLDHEGRRSADDAHRDMWQNGELPGIKTENDFKSFCAWIGREFVLDNLDFFGIDY